MKTIGIILILSILLGVCFGSWQDLFKSEQDKEYEKEEMGWFLYKLAIILSWIWPLFIIYFAFLIIKILWKLA